MQALFVHGMGRSPLSGWPMLRHIKKAGITTRCFGYSVSLQSFSEIQVRLTRWIEEIAAKGDYVLIGHSLGGVLIRSALSSLPAGTNQPKHIFLLGSPIQASQLAQRFNRNFLFRSVTRDCGHLLSSLERMAAIPCTEHSTTGIAGIKGLSGKLSPFRTEFNDGIVSLSEVSADWLTDQVKLPIIHSLLPSSKQVAQIIIQRINCKDTHAQFSNQIP